MDRREFMRLTSSGMAVGALAETLVSAQVARTPSTQKPGAANAAPLTVSATASIAAWVVGAAWFRAGPAGEHDPARFAHAAGPVAADDLVHRLQLV